MCTAPGPSGPPCTRTRAWRATTSRCGKNGAAGRRSSLRAPTTCGKTPLAAPAESPSCGRRSCAPGCTARCLSLPSPTSRRLHAAIAETFLALHGGAFHLPSNCGVAWETYKMRCDLHVHSKYSGAVNLPLLRNVGRECYSEPAEIDRPARSRGMDRVTISDHDPIADAL